MGEDAKPPPASAPDAPGVPYYEKSKQQLKELLKKRKILDQRLVSSTNGFRVGARQADGPSAANA
jgi:hypothetical protein